MTYRDRREARADRLDGWADKRETKGTADLAQARERAALIPFGQPMMPGHHSYKGDVAYRGRIQSGYQRGFENLNKADAMHSKAANIRDAAERAIYSDDENAIEALRARIDGLEQERARIKAYNATCRKGAPDETLLTENQRQALASQARHQASYHDRIKKQMPPYAAANLSGNISKQRARLAQLERQATTND